jgi:hypothetical protein
LVRLTPTGVEFHDYTIHESSDIFYAVGRGSAW